MPYRSLPKLLVTAAVCLLPLISSAADQTPDLSARLDSLDAQLAQIQQEVQAVLTSDQPIAVSAEDFMALLEDVQYLRAEITMLRTSAADSSAALASLDNEGFYVPGSSEPTVQELGERIEQLNVDIGQLQPTSGNVPAVGHGKVKISAYIQEHYSYVDNDDQTNSFSTKRARLIFKSEVNEYANLFIQGDFAGTPQLTDAVFTLSPSEHWSFSIGQTYPSATIDGCSSPAAYSFVNYTLLSSLESGRDVGFEVKHRRDLSTQVSMKFSAGLFNGAGMNTSDVNKDKNLTSRLDVTVNDMITVAPSFYHGRTNEADSINQSIDAFSGALRFGKNNEMASFQYLHRKVGDVTSVAWYLVAGHTFNIDAKFLPAVQLVGRYEQFDADVDVDGDRIDRATIGTNLFIDENFTRIQLNYEFDGGGQQEINNQFIANFQLAF